LIRRWLLEASDLQNAPSISRQTFFVDRPEIALDATPPADTKLNMMFGGYAAAGEQFTSLGKCRSHRVEWAQPAISPRLVE